MSANGIVCVIPAAGRGSRLGAVCPKVFVEIVESKTIFDILYAKIEPFVEQIVLVLSPDGLKYAEEHSLTVKYDKLKLAVQEYPIGMGDAVFAASSVWKHFSQLMVVWGDQVFLSDRSIRCLIDTHIGACDRGRQLTLPLVFVNNPYVEYCISPNGEIMDILQSREGDVCGATGFSDSGLFMLEIQCLEAAWSLYRSEESFGAVTSEVNFLPFLKWLSLKGWGTRTFRIEDAREARGINTTADLEFFRALYKGDRE